MEGRNYGSGFSNWGAGGSGNRGSGNFDLFGGNYKNSMSGFGGYGGGNSKRGPSGSSMLQQNADEVIAKINQRLDMLTQLEGGMKSRGDRFGQFDSFDSLSSSSSRDLYRSGGSSYGCDDGRGDNMLLGQRGGSGFGGGVGQGGGCGFNSLSSSFGVAKMRQNMRESFTGGSGGGGWAGAGRRSPRRGGGARGRGSGGGFGSYRSDPMSFGGGGRGSGHSPGGGRGKLPSLLSNHMYSERGGFHQGPSQGPHDFPGRHFGGGPRAGRQRGRKRPLNKVRPPNEVQKKRKQMVIPEDEPEPKLIKSESADLAASRDKNGDNSGVATTAAAEITEGSSGSTKQDEGSEKAVARGKPPPPRPPTKSAKAKKKRSFQDRVMFACSVCKFKSFYKDDMERHLESRFHKDHFKFLSSQLSKPTTDFLQEYLLNKFQKMDQIVSKIEHHSDAICQAYRDQDLTKDLGMEHFMKKVEAAHCSACDIFIPMELHLIQKHIKTPDHNYNRKGMMEQSKKSSLSVARSILNHKVIGKKLESYLKGENPFTGNPEGQDASESRAMDDATEEQKCVAAEEDPETRQETEVEEAKEIKMVEAEEVKEEEGTILEVQEDQEHQDDDGAEGEEGFEIGEDEDDEEGYVVHDEFEEDEEDEEGAEVAAAVVEDDEHKE
ncbi:A-kinase anchor protein 8-like isoform X4 [Syngnathus typhle]|uniref:A-kinase anchor protein 8-like isoform X4 n=1 Tax=Syngnathus typhle TaxID=161592 RepID=UPI002A6AD447|nr:A-kinase anchor protein 8-like isoform X4 [Syngnathus typhle]